MVSDPVHKLMELRGPASRVVEESWIASWHEVGELKGRLGFTDWRTHARVAAAGRHIIDVTNGIPRGLWPRRSQTMTGTADPPVWTSTIPSHPDNLSMTWEEVNSSEQLIEPSPRRDAIVTKHCRYWAQGRCDMGWRCPYKRDLNRLPTTSSTSSSSSCGLGRETSVRSSRDNQRARPAGKKEGRDVCWYWAKGKCVRGSACRYVHEQAGGSKEVVSPTDEEQEERLEARAFRHSNLATLNVPETELRVDPVTGYPASGEIEPSAEDEFEIVTPGWVDES